MHRLLVVATLAMAVLCTSCSTTFLLPTYENSRKIQGNKNLEEARQAFDMIVEGKTTEEEVRTLKFGVPYTDEEIIGPLRMTTALTQSQGIGDGVFLDPEIRKCVERIDAPEKCKLLVIRDGRLKRAGQGNTISYYTGFHRVDEVSSWSYTTWLVLEDSVVIHKQFEPSQSPPRIEDRARDFGRVVDYRIGVP